MRTAGDREDGTYTGRLLRFSQTDGSYLGSKDVWQNAPDNYQWCDYMGGDWDDLYWFNYEGYESGKINGRTKKFTETDGTTTECKKTFSGNTSQVLCYCLPSYLESRTIWSLTTLDKTGSPIAPIAYGASILQNYAADDYHGVNAHPTHLSTADAKSLAIPLSFADALIFRQNTDLGCVKFQDDTHNGKIDIDNTLSSGLQIENGLATLGGTTFRYNGIYYYVAGCGADYKDTNNQRTLHRGACAVYELIPSESYDYQGHLKAPITSAKAVATYGANIANMEKETSQENASEDVTFRAVVKDDYVLIYAFSPCNGLACYYFSTQHDYPYTVQFNNVADGQGTMADQTLYGGVPAALNTCELTRNFTITYEDNQNGNSTATVPSIFKGWEEKNTTFTYLKNTEHTVVTQWAREKFDAAYYAQQTGQAYNKTDLLNYYMANGGSLVGSETGLYPDGATVCDLASEAGAVVPLYAHWEDNTTKLPTPTHPLYNFKGWKTAQGDILNGGDMITVSADMTLTAQWEFKTDEGETDFCDRLVTWGWNTITFDLNAYYYVQNGRKYYPANTQTREWYINDIKASETGNPDYPAKDKTFTIKQPSGVSFTADTYIRVALYHTANGVRTLVAAHTFLIPYCSAFPQASGKDEYILANKSLSFGGFNNTFQNTFKNVYIEPGATFIIQANTAITITDTLYIRSRGTKVGQLINNGTLNIKPGNIVYTRQMAQKNTGEPLAMPFDCTLPKNEDGTAYVMLKTKLQAETGKEQDNHVVLYKYNGQIRADQGGDAIVWEKQFGPDITLQATDGYEIISGSSYYREYLFPMTYSQPTETTRQLTAYRAEHTAFNNIGWNFFCTPYTSNYTGALDLSDNTTQAYAFVIMYNADGSFNQTVDMDATIPPFTPYYVQVNEDALLTYQAGVPTRQIRARYSDEQTDATSWAGIVLSDGELTDKTALVINNRYSDEYEIGADLEKWFAATSVVRPQVYIPTQNGKRAFDAVSETAAVMPVPVGYMASQEGELTFSLNEALPLNRVAHLYLTDRETGITTDLTEADYTFTTDAGTYEARFTLSADYRRDVPTATDATEEQYPRIRKVLRDGELYIIVDGKTYDAQGRRR